MSNQNLILKYFNEYDLMIFFEFILFKTFLMIFKNLIY